MNKTTLPSLWMVMEGDYIRNKGRNFGHLNGVKTVLLIVQSSIKLKIID